MKKIYTKIIAITLIITFLLTSAGCSKNSDHVSEDMQRYAKTSINVIENYLNGHISASKASAELKKYSELSEKLVDEHKDETEYIYYSDSHVHTYIFLASISISNIADLSSYVNIEDSKDKLRDYVKTLKKYIEQ